MNVEQLKEIYNNGGRDFRNINLENTRIYGIFNGAVFLDACNLNRVDVYSAFCMNTVWNDGSIEVGSMYLE